MKPPAMPLQPIDVAVAMNAFAIGFTAALASPNAETWPEVLAELEHEIRSLASHMEPGVGATVILKQLETLLVASRPGATLDELGSLMPFISEARKRRGPAPNAKWPAIKTEADRVLPRAFKEGWSKTRFVEHLLAKFRDEVKRSRMWEEASDWYDEFIRTEKHKNP